MRDSEEEDTALTQAYMAGEAQRRREQVTGHEDPGKAGVQGTATSAQGRVCQRQSEQEGGMSLGTWAGESPGDRVMRKGEKEKLRQCSPT